ncbi:hypothetical protein [Phenylobacterium sp.]|uniref:hypothetical protein n=1 Tax=Phenylobacterium sp. TaxID=1871053 RepID=UPI0035B45968
MRTYTLRQMAELIGAADGRNAEGVAYLHQQLRNLHAKGFLIAGERRGIGRTSSSLFDEVELCRARLLSILYDLGFDARMLREASDRMSPSASGVRVSTGSDGERREDYYWDDPHSAERHLDKLPAAVREGEIWTLRLKLISQHGRKGISGGFHAAQDPQPSAEEERAVAAFYEHQELQVQATLTLPASDLVAPLVVEER